MKHFYKRIGYEGELSDISKMICDNYNLGDFVSNKLVPLGYEDFNFILETTKGKFFVKILSNFRSDDDCHAYVDKMSKVIENNITFPKLFKSSQGYLHIAHVNESKLRFTVMEFIDGESYYVLKEKPNSDDIRELARQAALTNSMDIKPPLFYDSWAVTNFLKEYEKKEKHLQSEDVEMIEPLVKEFKEMKIDELPHCFVHGDYIVTNVMRDKNKKLWVIDFSVSNYYPRIQELAVMACNLLFDEKSKENSENNLKTALDEYQKTIKLTPRELEVLPTYIKLAHAMHILSANHEKIVEKNNSKENEYWLSQGRMGLK